MASATDRAYDRHSSVVFRMTAAKFGGLSNMAPGFPLSVNGIPIRTSEALYQACRFPHMPEVQQLILEQNSPMAAKMRSRPFRANSRVDWDAVRVPIMRWCLRVKLAQNWDKFGALLRATGTEPIVEESKRDDFWGANPTDTGGLVGKNVLGRLLMELRETLQKPDAESLRQVMPLAIPQFELCGHPIAVVGASVKPHNEIDGTVDLNPVPASTPEALPLFAATTGDQAYVHEYFSVVETAKLERLGVTFSKQGLRLSKELTDLELRFVWQAISALERRAPNLKDAVKWMIGDWMNAAARSHNKHWPVRIIREEGEFYQFRRRLLELSGTVLIALQMLEFTIGVVVRALEPSPNPTTTGDVFSPDKVTRGRTLGRLNRELKNRHIFVDDFQERMDCFVELRNRFTHSAWTAAFSDLPGDHSQRMKALHELQTLMLSLLREADAINTVFRGFIAKIGATLTNQTDTVRDWLDDAEGSLAAFSRVLRTPSD